MSKVENIEQEIRALTSAELAAFRRWFLEFDAQVWDRQIEEDVRDGRLDKLADEALAAHRAGHGDGGCHRGARAAGRAILRPCRVDRADAWEHDRTRGADVVAVVVGVVRADVGDGGGGGVLRWGWDHLRDVPGDQGGEAGSDCGASARVRVQIANSNK